MIQFPSSIAAALVEAQRAAKDVAKASKNDFHKYRYAASEDVVDEARDALNRAGLACSRIGWDLIQVGEENEDYIRVTYALFHTSGESVVLPPTCTPAIPEKGRPLDKAVSAALTLNQSYFLLGLLEIKRADENEVDARDDREHTPRRLQQRPQQANHRAQEGGTVVLRGKFDDVTDPAELKAFIEARRQGLHEAAAKGQDIKGKIVAAADRVGVDPADALAWWGKP